MSSVAALKLVACQVAVSSPKLKAILSARDVGVGLLLTFFKIFQFHIFDGFMQLLVVSSSKKML